MLLAVMSNLTKAARSISEALAVSIFALATPYAIWQGSGQLVVLALVVAVVLLLRPNRGGHFLDLLLSQLGKKPFAGRSRREKN